MKLLLTVLPALLAGLIGVAAGMAIEHHRSQPLLNSLLKGGENYCATLTAIPSNSPRRVVRLAQPRGAVSTLRALSGTLLVNSVPTGAAISVNGKKQTWTSPAQLRLPPGSYRITVEKDGLQGTSLVEIRDGSTLFVRVPLHPVARAYGAR